MESIIMITEFHEILNVSNIESRSNVMPYLDNPPESVRPGQNSATQAMRVQCQCVYFKNVLHHWVDLH